MTLTIEGKIEPINKDGEVTMDEMVGTNEEKVEALDLQEESMAVKTDTDIEPTDAMVREGIWQRDRSSEPTVVKYTIDTEFQTMFDKKTQEEHENLKEAIRNDGIREPLTVWKETGNLVDGHGRDEVCLELGITPPICYLSFDNREHAKLWVVKNQRNRRNQNRFQKIEAALQFNDFFAAKAKENQLAGTALQPAELVDADKEVSVGDLPQTFVEGVETNKEIAKLASTNHEAVRRVKHIYLKRLEIGCFRMTGI